MNISRKNALIFILILTIIQTAFLWNCARPKAPAGTDAANPNVWSFGVMGDTQWTTADNADKNPGTVAVEIIKQLNQEFIAKGVKFVIQVGDLADGANATNNGFAITSKYRQDLYNAGIGFFPIRGNHDYSAFAAKEVARAFPQNRDGMQNNLPADILALETPAGPAAKTGKVFQVGSNFSSPAVSGTDYRGLTYSFSYNNATFVLLDQFEPISGSYPGLDKTIEAKQCWINEVLDGRPRGSHAFVFGHKGLIHENHRDGLFGANPSVNPTGQDNFIKSLTANGVKYYICGHDHVHNRSIYTTTDGNMDTSVHHVTSASCSSKFYTPASKHPDERDNLGVFGKRRQTQLSQELFTIGYYIYTVDGNNVTVDYYSTGPVTGVAPGTFTNPPDITATPALRFTKKETWGYSLGGKRFIIAPGGSYTAVQDGRAKILGGAFSSAAVDWNGRKFSREVTTGWAPKTAGMYTDIFTLWGMAKEFGSPQTDTYCLSIAYDPKIINDEHAKYGQVGITTKGKDSWVNAVSKNYGGATNFFVGPYDQSKHALGAWGVDADSQTFWAVINYNADFAVAPNP
jgi:hypothetical protein